jgi:deoxyribodipyrimidine photo-lyase
MTIGLFIHRRDFRTEDNLSLIELSKHCDKIYSIFIFTPTQTKKNKYFSSNSFQFLVESLEHQKHVSIFYGDDISVLKTILSKYDIDYIAQNRDYTPYAKKRDGKIQRLCKQHSIEYISLDDYTIHPMEDIRDGGYYSVFTPFYKRVLGMDIPSIQKMKKVSFGRLKTKDSTSFDKIKKMYTYNKQVLVKGGRKNGLKILKNLKKFKTYAKTRDIPSKKTTLLSAYIKYGCVSIREVYKAMIKATGKSSELVRQLIWHDFYACMMNYLPSSQTIGKSNYKKKTIKWIYNKRYLKKWYEGNTGFPIIDASMRQLVTEGWMPNRCRLLVSNFLVAILHQDWRYGEKFFAQHLVDYDVASNNLNWQFSAGVGTDRVPYVRIYNPFKQSSDIDKDCAYIKQWIPELKDVESRIIHHWDTRYDEVDTDYPKPIVDFKTEQAVGKKLLK